MRILIAEDDAFSRRLITSILENAGHEVLSCVDGIAAVEAYEKEQSIELVILDWMMPGRSGLEVCKTIKADAENPLTYVIMLTAKSKSEDLAVALESGADDFIAKPFDAIELIARINAGIRIIRIQNAMMDHIQELEESLSHIEQLQGILPICDLCKKVRDDSDYWGSVEEYLSKYSRAQFSHSICPVCLEEKYLNGAKEIANDECIPRV